jgi:Spy/CpxP family protein refolding chaperone
MRKFALTLMAAALALGTTAIAAAAQTQSQGAAGSHEQLKSVTSIVTQVACTGRTGGHGCGPGFVWNGARCVRC